MTIKTCEIHVAGHTLRQSMPGLDFEIKRIKSSLMNYSQSELTKVLEEEEEEFINKINLLVLDTLSLQTLANFMAIYELVNNIEESTNPLVINYLETCYRN